MLDLRTERKRVKMDLAQIEKVWNGLLIDGHSLSSKPVLLVEEKIPALLIKNYVLQKGEAAGAKLLSRLGIRQN